MQYLIGPSPNHFTNQIFHLPRAIREPAGGNRWSSPPFDLKNCSLMSDMFRDGINESGSTKKQNKNNEFLLPTNIILFFQRIMVFATPNAFTFGFVLLPSTSDRQCSTWTRSELTPQSEHNYFCCISVLNMTCIYTQIAKNYSIMSQNGIWTMIWYLWLGFDFTGYHSATLPLAYIQSLIFELDMIAR